MKTLISASIFSPGQIVGITAVSLVLAAAVGAVIYLGYLLHKRGVRTMQTDTLQQQRNALIKRLQQMNAGQLDDLPETKVLFAVKDDDDEETESDDETETEELSDESEEESLEVEVNEAGNVVRYDRSFQARIIQGDNDLKARYSELKNYILAYGGVRPNISWRRELFRAGRRSIAGFTVRGKTLCLSLATDPAMFDNTKYKVRDVSGAKRKNTLPCMYRITSDRKTSYAKELIDIVMEGFKLERSLAFFPADYTLPYKSTEALIKRRLVKVSGNVSETAKEDAVAAAKGISYNRSFTARIIQSDDALKARYSKLKNHIMSYSDVTCADSWKHEAFRVGRDTIAMFKVSGKTLGLFLAADPAGFDGTKYKVERAGARSKTPLKYRIKNDRRLNYAVQLIDKVFSARGLGKTEAKQENYAVPFTSTETLIRRGLIRVTENTAAKWRAGSKTDGAERDNNVSGAEAAATSFESGASE